MRKRTVIRSIIFTIGIITFSLTGCGKNSGDVKLIDRQPETTVIHMFGGGGGKFSTSDQAKYWSENFTKLTGINAIIDYDEQSHYYAEEGQSTRELLRQRIESNQPDDMYLVYAEDMVEYAEKGYILDLSDFDFVENLSEPAKQLSTIDGKVYCLPLSFTGAGLYWNVDLLHKHGLEVPENYQELIKVWDALLEKGITPYVGNKGYGLTVPAMCIGLAEVYQSPEKDKLIQDLADGTTPISTYLRKGFEFIRLMFDKGYMDCEMAVRTDPRSEDERLPFLNGEAACVCSMMSLKYYCDPAETGFQVKMTGWPLLEDGQIAVVGTDQKLCINPATKHLDIVSAFVEMAGTQEALMQCTEDGKVSAGKVNDPSKYRASEKEFDELIQSPGQIPNTDMNLKLNLWEDIRDISRQVVTGEITVEEACLMLDEKQRQQIDD